MLSADAAQRILDEADLVVPEQDAAAAVRRVAAEISMAMRETHPLVLSVMGGAVIFTGHLLPLLHFPLEFDYLHVTRYGDTTTGGELSWIVAPRAPIAGRTVLVVDDILDEGITLAAV
ncbi:MAG: hypoxanthine-guanine phosphoribosyltransferase, partial [Sulfuritalea sp.]|nr:hypoxanthine-guanine phosphoribosyltransferase [Sulfuritalea sp.]